ncbi:uncharacterized protein TNCV_853131 [Trichonephila clavipes]|nr:uncharacterized protein TNCV_853131 [Trichonephila clavipes]
MSWTYHWTVMVSQIITRGDRLKWYAASLETEASMSGRQGQHTYGRRDPKCPSTRRLRMVLEGTCSPSEGAWMAADEAVGCTRVFLTMWRSSRRLVCRVRPEPGLCVNCLSQIHWSQHLLTTQSERPN